MARGKKVNTKAKIKNIDINDKLPVDIDAEIAELEKKLKLMNEDRDRKLESAKTQLVEMLDITIDKYKTATGTAEALRVLRFVFDDNADGMISAANELAWRMADEVADMKKAAEDTDPVEMDSICDGFYDKEFHCGEEQTRLAFEMMRIDLCRNVGPAADDMVSFINRSNEEIEATQKALDELKASKEE